MKTSNLNRGMAGVFLILLCGASASHAEIFKWVDANGKTHYSEYKEDAGPAKVTALKVISQPSAQAIKSSQQSWQEEEELFKLRQAKKRASNRPVGPSMNTRPKSLSGGKSDDTDASRCNLARDVNNGALRHSNGAPIDKYDRETADNDIRAFCR